MRSVSPDLIERAEDRSARLAFLATEGAFMLRFFGLLEMDDAQWRGIFEDIEGLLPEKR